MLKLKTMGAVLGIALITPLAMMAQHHEHPHYMEALRQLHFARALLEPGDRGWGPVAADQQRATAEIDRAIEEIRHAAEMDGRNPNNLPPVDMHWEPRDRIRRSMEALDHARGEISQAEMNPAAHMVRDRAFRHIEEARRALRHAVERWHEH